MKMRIGHLLILLLITLVAAPAYAAMYDATGMWTINPDPGQEVTIGPFGTGMDIPVIPVTVMIDQHEDGERFDLSVVSIGDINDIDFSASGSISGSQYVLDGYEFNANDIGDKLGVDNLNGSVDVGIGFNLTSEETLDGSLIVNVNHELFYLNGDIDFSGTRDNVPVPAAVWLLGSGMVSLFGLRKRVKA